MGMGGLEDSAPQVHHADLFVSSASTSMSFPSNPRVWIERYPLNAGVALAAAPLL